MPPLNLIDLDVTELAETDNLHEPTGCIKETQERISQIYGAETSFLLVNGSSSGIIAAICATCSRGDTIAVDRRSHKSVYSALILSGANPVYFWGFDQIPAAKVIVITSPTYEGITADVANILEKNRESILIVDEAHGAHFPFHPIFPKGALHHGADVVIHSFHKTLPAFSQSAVLHIRGNRVDRDKLKVFLAIMQTSSPSYLIMASTDYTLNTLRKNPDLFERYVERLIELRKALALHDSPGSPSSSGSSSNDISKLLLNISNARELEVAYNLAFEAISPTSALALTSVADTEDGFMRLKNAIKLAKPACPAKDTPPPLPQLITTPQEAMQKTTKTAKLKDSLNEVAASFIAPVPPGIPIIAPGELITQDVINYCTKDYDLQIIKGDEET